MRQFVVLLICCTMVFAPLPARAADTLKVIIVDGDEAANVVAERLAAEPVIEVRDKDDRRVPGAVVRFVIRKTRDRLIASFGNGQAEVRTLTDYAGRASVNAVSPVEAGSFQIDVEVSYRGQTGKAVIRQTNFPTSVDAKSAGREPGKSTNSTTQASTTGATSGAPATTGAATTSATATASTAAAAAGGGMSKLAVVGLLVGGAAGAGAAVALTRKEDRPAGVISAVTPSQTGGVQGASRFTFSVQATGFDAGSVAYRWEFGDGGTSDEASPTHVYTQAGTFTVVVSVSDSRQTVRSETTVSVFSLTGTWTDPNGSTGGAVTLYLVQSGTTVTGTSTWERSVVSPYTGCSLSGTVEPGTPVSIVLNQPPCPHPETPPLVPLIYRLGVVVGGQTLSGTRETAIFPQQNPPAPIRLNRQ